MLLNIYGQRVIRPTRIDFGGDGGFYLTNLVWTRWTGTSAAATGRAHENDCVPSCAAGHFHVHRATVTVAGVKRCPNGRRVFTSIRYVQAGDSTAYYAFGVTRRRDCR